MCGRASVLSPAAILEERFCATLGVGVKIRESVNISAGDKMPVITSEDPDTIQLFTFGFTPHWAHKQTYVINARMEGSLNPENKLDYDGPAGILKKPMFRHAVRSQRCLVLVDAFIEGPQHEKLNKPYVVYPNRDRGPFALAGIYDTWQHPLSGELHHTFAIITTPANRLTQRIGHHRAPAVLDREDEKVWLDTSISYRDAVAMLKPFDSKRFNAHPISTKIKSPKNDGFDLLKPTGEKIFKDYDRGLYERMKYREDIPAMIKEERLVEGDQLVMF